MFQTKQQAAKRKNGGMSNLNVPSVNDMPTIKNAASTEPNPAAAQTSGQTSPQNTSSQGATFYIYKPAAERTSPMLQLAQINILTSNDIEKTTPTATTTAAQASGQAPDNSLVQNPPQNIPSHDGTVIYASAAKNSTATVQNNSLVGLQEEHTRLKEEAAPIGAKFANLRYATTIMTETATYFDTVVSDRTSEANLLTDQISTDLPSNVAEDAAAVRKYNQDTIGLVEANFETGRWLIEGHAGIEFAQ